MRADYGPILGSGFIHLASTLILVFGGVLAYHWWRDPLMHQTAMVVLAVSVVPTAITIFRVTRLRRALGSADLEIDDPVPMGFSGTATYARPLRGAEVLAVEARLQCEEEILKGRGKNKRRIKKIVYDEPLAPIVTPRMERLEVRLPFRIPPGGPPTLWYEEAATTWWIRLKLRMSGCPNTESSFRVDVRPAVVGR